MPAAGSPRKARACARWRSRRGWRGWPWVRTHSGRGGMIVDSHRVGAGEEAADIAAVLTERGLGGDSVDLDFRLDQFRRDRSQRATSARSLAQRWASQVAAEAPASSAAQDGGDLSTGVMLAFAFP